MNEPRDGFSGFQAIFGEDATVEVNDSELAEIDELRRLASDVAEPEVSGYTVGVNGGAPDFTVHFRTVVR